MHCAHISEHELHAFVDRQLANERRRDVIAYLAAHPAAANRVTAFVHERAALAALAQYMAPTGERAPAELEQALCRMIRRHARLGGHRGRRRKPTGGRRLPHQPAAFGAEDLWADAA